MSDETITVIPNRCDISEVSEEFVSCTTKCGNSSTANHILNNKNDKNSQFNYKVNSETALRANIADNKDKQKIDSTEHCLINNKEKISAEFNIRKKIIQNNSGKIFSRNLSYQKATDDCPSHFPESSSCNSIAENAICNNDRKDGISQQNSVKSRKEKPHCTAISQKTTNFLENPREDILRSSSFTYGKGVLKICDYRSFPLQKNKCCSSDVSSVIEKTSSNHSRSLSKTSTMVPSLDAASQTSHKKGLMNSIARQLSFRSGKKNAPKQLPELTDLKGEPGVIEYSSMIRLFECPGCGELMNPPLYQCRKGHIVCEKCKVTLKYICPDCRQRITEETNVMMERVCHLISFPCRFNKYGCTEYYHPVNKQNHETFCQYRPVHCHFSSHGCQKFLTLMEMKVHVEECNFREFATDL